MRLVIGASGASGAIYLQRLLTHLDAARSSPNREPAPLEVHLVLSPHARQVIREELGDLAVPDWIHRHPDGPGMSVPFVSGSARFDAMAVVPCSMGTIGRIASGASESTLLRAADVFLKERRPLILVPRETPWNLIHARNAATLIEAGAIILPACPSFYGRPQSVNEVADTVVFRILDHLGLPSPRAHRWKGSPDA